MTQQGRILSLLITVAVVVGLLTSYERLYLFFTRGPAEIAKVRQRVLPDLNAELDAAGLTFGSPTFIRIFKEEHILEIWLQAGEAFQHFRSYEICNYSGDLGPKLQEGDRQSPEGFYTVARDALNPNSRYHLSFNLGFPNAFDQANGRTGSFLMIHGDCVSVGCYAMTDAGIEEIYLIVEAALSGGQSAVPVHAFPFRLTAERLDLARDHTWFAYWQNLKVGYDLFEKDRVPPSVTVSGTAYAFQR